MCIVLVSAIALISVSDSSVSSTPSNELLKRAPPDAYLVVAGLVYEADGVTPAIDCIVNMTNKNTSAWGLTMTDAYGYYEFYTENFGTPPLYNDVINVTVTKDSQIGWNETVVGDAFIVLWIDVTLTAAIPEFPSLLVPVLGLVCLVVLSGRKR